MKKSVIVTGGTQGIGAGVIPPEMGRLKTA